jgi:mRNA interferase MazF
VVRPDAVPERGDVVWLAFSPQAGREQAGRRPALVLTPASFNGRTGLAFVCPITSRVKGYPFEVMLRAGDISGVALVDQLRSLDWRARRAEPAGAAQAAAMAEVVAKLWALLGGATAPDPRANRGRSGKPAKVT